MDVLIKCLLLDYNCEYNKAVLEPRVSPAFAITYFCNHCNIRFENTSKYVDTLTLFPKTWTKGHWPLDNLWPHVCWGHMCDSTQGSLSQVPWQYINVCGYSDQFCKIPHTYTYYIHTHTTYEGHSVNSEIRYVNAIAYLLAESWCCLYKAPTFMSHNTKETIS